MNLTKCDRSDWSIIQTVELVISYVTLLEVIMKKSEVTEELGCQDLGLS